jgi:two-component system, cell cycle sensor histidine kinase and response regulator CckA
MTDAVARPRVVVVDDELALQRMLVRLLQQEGYEVAAFATGEDALAWLEAEKGHEMAVLDVGATWKPEPPPITVVSDVRLPHMNGCALGREIVKRWPETRMLFISGYFEEELRAKRVCPGNMPFLPKPFTVEQFIRAVEERIQADPWVPNDDEWPEPEGRLD